MSRRKKTIHVRVDDGGSAVVQASSTDGSSACSFTIMVDDSAEITVSGPEKEPVPERNPLHPQALKASELRVGMRIQRYHDGEPVYNTGIIIGEKFIYCNENMIPVVTTDYYGKLTKENWYLGDMGVTRYTCSDGTLGGWNSSNHTLKVD